MIECNKNVIKINSYKAKRQEGCDFYKSLGRQKALI